jgi:hypothetical protein
VLDQAHGPVTFISVWDGDKLVGVVTGAEVQAATRRA